jgi:glutaredoxin/glutathione-dependent peroxiredoxin
MIVARQFIATTNTIGRVSGVDTVLRNGLKKCISPCLGSHSEMTRNISIGTNLQSTAVTLQKARVWAQCASEGSNQKSDNEIKLTDLFSNGRTVVVFGVPAPFTGACTHLHYPGYATAAPQLYNAGVHSILCYSVTDPYAHHGWALSMQNNPDHITFVADPDASFAKAYGIDTNYDAVSLGTRSKRFSMIVQNGIVQTFRLVDDAATDAKEVLEELQELKENAPIST